MLAASGPEQARRKSRYIDICEIALSDPLRGECFVRSALYPGQRSMRDAGCPIWIAKRIKPGFSSNSEQCHLQTSLTVDSPAVLGPIMSNPGKNSSHVAILMA